MWISQWFRRKERKRGVVSEGRACGDEDGEHDGDGDGGGGKCEVMAGSGKSRGRRRFAKGESGVMWRKLGWMRRES